VLGVGGEWLLSLKVVYILHNNIIHVFVLCRVVQDVLVEPGERGVDLWHDLAPMCELLQPNCGSLVELEERILVMAILDIGVSSRAVSTTKSDLFTVLVNPPEVVDAIVGRLVVTITDHEGGNHGPKSNILRFQFEESCNKRIKKTSGYLRERNVSLATSFIPKAATLAAMPMFCAALRTSSTSFIEETALS
jgi:hypothetical protein